MAFNIRNIFSPGGEAGTTTVLGAPSGGQPQSPFLMGESSAPVRQASPPVAMSAFPGFGSPPPTPVFQPIDQAFSILNAQEPQRQPSGGGAVTSPFSMNAGPNLTVADLLPLLPVEVVRANGTAPDQPVGLTPQVLEQAQSQGGVPLFEIFRVCPGLFQVPISPADHRRVPLPGMASRAPASPAPDGPRRR